MKPATFEYHAPETVENVCSILADRADDARLLAGGQSLVPMLSLRLTRFPHLVDLSRVRELKGVIRTDQSVVVKAMTTQTELGRFEAIDAVPLLGRSVPLIGHFQIRNRGTVGGSIAHADPAAELPAVAVALDARVKILSSEGVRHVGATDFFTGTWSTTLQATEVLTEVQFPTWSGHCGFAADEVARRAGDFALTGTVCGVEIDGTRVRRACIAMFGMGMTPLRASEAESALIDVDPSPADLVEIGQLAVEYSDPPEDIHASSRYRRVVGARLVTRALGRALEEARGA